MKDGAPITANQHAELRKLLVSFAQPQSPKPLRTFATNMLLDFAVGTALLTRASGAFGGYADSGRKARERTDQLLNRAG